MGRYTLKALLQRLIDSGSVLIYGRRMTLRSYYMAVVLEALAGELQGAAWSYLYAAQCRKTRV